MADPDQFLGSHIRSARIAAGMSQTELAALLGVRFAVVNSWERGHSKPKPDRMAMLTERFGVQPGEPPPPTMERRCLTCRRLFASKWIGNRVCKGCKETNAFVCATEFQVAR